MATDHAAPQAGSRRVRAILIVGALVLIAVAAVLLARWWRATDAGMDFIASYPGIYALPDGAPVGLPAWLGWQHFFNIFFLALIIRTGWQVRQETSPRALWTSRRNKRRRMSLTVWFHVAIDVLWVANGILYVVLLFSTGQWMRIVPTSWEVFPNAISAGVQYLSLDWRTENSWVNYNSLQQLSYFVTVFVAAPIAAATGVRMSAFWPRDAARVNAAFPFEIAKRLHFPVMLYFVAFITVHVGLVLATGAQRNLNHMFASRDDASWVGFWLFVVALVVTAAAVLAARRRVIAWIARRFGDVVER